VIVTRRTGRAAEAVWRRLCEGVTAPWLDEVRDLRTHLDDFETSLDIWSVALTAALRDPERKETASLVLMRLNALGDEAAGPQTGPPVLDLELR
jgi:hypothetical protein